MKKVSMISFSKAGEVLEGVIEEKIRRDFDCHKYIFEKYYRGYGISISSGKDCMKKLFMDGTDYIVFVGACGMAVRLADGLISGKDCDPAIIVVDTKGKFVISLLAGHLGGGNSFTNYLAEKMGAVPVITTATDVSEKFSPDSFAKANNLVMTDLNKAKNVAAKVLNDEKIRFYSEYEIENFSDKYELVEDKRLADIAICVEADKNALLLMPKNIILGVGCRKDIESIIFEKEILAGLNENKIDIRRVRELRSISLKSREKAIRDFCDKYGIEASFFEPEELNCVGGDFTKSDFVKEITGVDNVCERSAVVRGEKLLVKKHAKNGVTLAIAESEVSIDMIREINPVK